MLPTGSISSGNASSSGGKTASIDQLLTSGREISAVVKQVATGKLDARVFRVQVESGNRLLELVTRTPLNTGDRITLSRMPTGELRITLSAPNQTTAAPVSSPGLNAMQQALREALPRQIPFGDALNQLALMNKNPAVRGQAAIGQLVHSMLGLFSIVPGSPEAGQAIQRNLQQGGLLTESRLAQGRGTSLPDLKHYLGQLLKAAEQLPPEPRQQMQRLADALQARATSQQLASLQSWKELPDGSLEREFRLDLPIRQEERHDTAEMTIRERRPAPSGEERQSSWSVMLHFDLQQQGNLNVSLELHEGWRLQLQFWAEHDATLGTIERQQEGFAQMLHDKGFMVDRMQACLGNPRPASAVRVRHPLVDIHT